MNEARSLLAFGHFSRHQRQQLAMAGQESAFDLHLEDDVEQASEWVAEHHPHAILVDGDRGQGEQLALDARIHSVSARTPIFSLVENVTDLAFGDAFGWGGDDVVSLSSSWHLIRRLRALPREAPTPPENGRGKALVADADRRRRIALGRVLRNAGFTVTFAVNAEDARTFASNPEVALVVASSDLEGGTAELVQRAAGGSAAAWVVPCPPRELRTWRAALEGVERATPVDGFAPPENVLFLLNELSHKHENKRSSARLLYGTSVAFRGAGRDEDDFGFTFNLSAGGLYVRTLAPPEDDLVWLELTPPRSERRARLVGRVAWRRGVAHSATATVPPGFGVEIVDGASMDLELWRTGYSAFAQSVG